MKDFTRLVSSTDLPIAREC